MEAIIAKWLDEQIETFAGAKNTPELMSAVKRIMPNDEQDYKVVELVGNVMKFKAKILANIKDEADFIRSYCQKNNE